MTHLSPKRVTIEITSRCNFNCRHCFNRRGGPGTGAALRADKLVNLVEEACRLGWSRVLITGGEPLCHKQFALCYTRLNELPIELSLNTNASLMTRETACLLKERPPEALSVSLYGWDSPSYDQTVRVPGSFRKFCEGVQILNDVGVPFRMAYPAISYLVHNRHRLSALAQDLGAMGELPWNWDLNCHAYRSRLANESIRALRLSPSECAAEILKHEEAIRGEVRAMCHPARRDNRYLFSCLRNYTHIVIDAECNLLPCITLRRPEFMCSLNDVSLAHAVTHHIPRLTSIRRRTMVAAQRCGTCGLAGICSQCPANSYLENGDTEAIADFYCRVAHEEAALLGVSPQDRPVAEAAACATAVP